MKLTLCTFQCCHPTELDLVMESDDGDALKETARRLVKEICRPHAEGVFYDPLAIYLPDPDAEGEEGFVALGLGSAGDLLVVRLYPARR